MKINWQITLLSLIALFTGIVVYTIWSVYNFAPVKMALAQATAEMEGAVAKAEFEALEAKRRLEYQTRETRSGSGSQHRETTQALYGVN